MLSDRYATCKSRITSTQIVAFPTCEMFCFLRNFWTGRCFGLLQNWFMPFYLKGPLPRPGGFQCCPKSKGQQCFKLNSAPLQQKCAANPSVTAFICLLITIHFRTAPNFLFYYAFCRPAAHKFPTAMIALCLIVNGSLTTLLTAGAFAWEPAL